MFFKNLVLYRLPNGLSLDPAVLNQQLQARSFQPCGNTDPASIGWIPAKESNNSGAGDDHEATPYARHVAGHYLIAFKQETKPIPASHIRRCTEERIAQIEAQEGRRVGRKEKNEIKDQIIINLLPGAYPVEKVTHAWIDPKGGWLAIDASSFTRAEALLELLRKTLDPMPVVRNLKPVTSPSGAMNTWLAGGEAPDGFTVDQDLELRTPDEGKVRYVNHALEGNEIRQYIADGKVVTRLGITWNDRISFVLNQDLRLGRIKFLDILKEQTAGQAEDENEQFDLDFTLMTGELSTLLSSLVDALGGEQPEEQGSVSGALSPAEPCLEAA